MRRAGMPNRIPCADLLPAKTVIERVGPASPGIAQIAVRILPLGQRAQELTDDASTAGGNLSGGACVDPDDQRAHRPVVASNHRVCGGWQVPVASLEPADACGPQSR